MPEQKPLFPSNAALWIGVAAAVAMAFAFPVVGLLGLFAAVPLIVLALLLGRLSIGRWIALGLPLAVAAIAYAQPEEADGSRPGAEVAALAAFVALLVAFGIAVHRVGRVLTAHAATSGSPWRRALGRPAEPEPLVELQSDSRALVWFLCLFAPVVLIAARTAEPSGGGFLGPDRVILAGALAAAIAFLLPPRRRRVATVLVLGAIAAAAYAYGALVVAYLILAAGCPDGAYECPI